MKILNFIKSKGFKIYLVIGLIVYIVPYLFGLTNAVRVYLEHKTIFSDYIHEIKSVYINNEKDLAMCVHGNTKAQFDIEYWLYIPYSYYENTEKNFKGNNHSLSGIPNDQFKLVDCSHNAWEKIKYSDYKVDIKEDEIDKFNTGLNYFKSKSDYPDNTTLYHLNFLEGQRPTTELILVRYENDKRLITTFMMSTLNYRDKLNPLWNLLYIPAFILDVLLWPIYLLLFIYSPYP